MSINLFSLTITFKKREISLDEAVEQERIDNLYEQHKNRQFSMYRMI
ncbi:YrzI family small protein [Neobacillus kokaensis]|uniref:Sporulation protein n=1 Tax=Neobacillus kokaensis TaxID=2759023 RepID=A0ABQ3N8B2_9BACI|nr:YrzI family small protein [Neobacillus kokaensis]GHI00312.1 hypothetical protein AM1BK_38540 [Neobacillus kokaensis]